MSPRSIIFVTLAIGTGLGIAVRLAVEPPATDAKIDASEVSDWLFDRGIELGPRETRARLLRWRPPEECIVVYRIRVDEEMPDGVARFFNRSPEHSEAWLALTPHPHPDAGRDASGLRVVRGRAVLESDDAGVKPYETGAPSPISSTRDYYASGLGLGPAAPDAACRNRSWDALEDALALGWPWLAPQRIAPGESWAGAPVEGRCNETACLTSDGVAGARAHERICATPGWRETWVGDAVAGEEVFTAIESTWQDRGDLEEIEGGTSTTRRALLSPVHGRLAWARVEVLHRWSQVQREIVIESVDACPGSLRAAGWDAPPEVVEQADRMAARALEDRPEREANQDTAR
jgi:hypothetical protein